MAAELGFNIVAHNRASKGLQAAAKDFQGLEKKASAAGKNSGSGFRKGFDKRIKGIGGKLKTGLKAGGAAAGAAAGAVIASGIEEAIAQADVSANLGAQLALDPTVAKEAGKVAGRIYSNAWGESLDQIEQAAVATVQNLNVAVSDVDFQPLVTDALIFSEVFGQDVTRSVQAVGRMMKTGMVKDGKEGFDSLTRLFQQAGGVTDDLLDTLIEYPVQFERLGLSGEDAMGLMIQGLEGGARDSDKVADALKELQVRVIALDNEDALETLGLDAEKMSDAFAEGGPKARKALGEILDKLRGVKDPAERARLGVELFGTQAEDMAGALNEMDLSKARDELGQIEGAVTDAGNAATNSVGASWDSFRRNLGGIISGLVTGDFEKLKDSSHSLFVREIPGHASAATEATEGWSAKLARHLGRSVRGLGGVENGATRAARALGLLPKKTVAQVRADTSRFWAAWNAIAASPLSKVINLVPGGSIAAFGLNALTSHAHGGRFPRGEVALVGEEGPEIVRFDGNGEVFPHRESMQMLRGGGGGMSASSGPQRVVVEFDFRGDADLVRFFRKAINSRGGSVQKVLGS